MNLFNPAVLVIVVLQLLPSVTLAAEPVAGAGVRRREHRRLGPRAVGALVAREHVERPGIRAGRHARQVGEGRGHHDRQAP